MDDLLTGTLWRPVVAIWIEKSKDLYHLSDSLGHKVTVRSAKDLYDFLLYNARGNCFLVTWNLFQLLDVLKSVLPLSALKQIQDRDRVEYQEDTETYRLFHSAGKVFSLTHKLPVSDEVDIYHLGQYFPNEKATSLQEVLKHGQELVRTLDSLGLHPRKLSSPIAIYDECVLRKQHIPTIYDLPEEGMDFCEYAYHLMNREWRSVYRLGHWPEATDYDTRAGYPSIIRDFRDLTTCRFWHAKTLQRSDFGILKGTIHITSDYCPIVNQSGRNCKGTYTDYFTTEQIGYLYYYKQGTFDLEDGWFLQFRDTATAYPFYQIMMDLYAWRPQGGLIKDLSKAISVGISGRFSQEYPERYGDYYNPIYAVMTTSRMSLHVGKFIEANKLHAALISVVVDGCLASLDVPVPDSTEMGSWRKNTVPALVLSLGYQFVGNKRPNNVTYAQMIAAIQERPGANYYHGVLLAPEMLAATRCFSAFPRTGQQLLSNIYTSTAPVSR